MKRNFHENPCEDDGMMVKDENFYDMSSDAFDANAFNVPRPDGLTQPIDPGFGPGNGDGGYPDDGGYPSYSSPQSQKEVYKTICKRNSGFKCKSVKKINLRNSAGKQKIICRSKTFCAWFNEANGKFYNVILHKKNPKKVLRISVNQGELQSILDKASGGSMSFDEMGDERNDVMAESDERSLVALYNQQRQEQEEPKYHSRERRLIRGRKLFITGLTSIASFLGAVSKGVGAIKTIMSMFGTSTYKTLVHRFRLRGLETINVHTHVSEERFYAGGQRHQAKSFYKTLDRYLKKNIGMNKKQANAALKVYSQPFRDQASGASWHEFDTMFTSGKGGKVTQFSLFLNRDACEMISMVLLVNKNAFTLADDLLVIGQGKSTMGGAFSDYRISFKTKKSPINGDQLNFLNAYFRQVTYMQFQRTSNLHNAYATNALETLETQIEEEQQMDQCWRPGKKVHPNLTEEEFKQALKRL